MYQPMQPVTPAPHAQKARMKHMPYHLTPIVEHRVESLDQPLYTPSKDVRSLQRSAHGSASQPLLPLLHSPSASQYVNPSSYASTASLNTNHTLSQRSLYASSSNLSASVGELQPSMSTAALQFVNSSASLHDATHDNQRTKTPIIGSHPIRFRPPPKTVRARKVVHANDAAGVMAVSEEERQQLLHMYRMKQQRRRDHLDAIPDENSEETVDSENAEQSSSSQASPARQSVMLMQMSHASLQSEHTSRRASTNRRHSTLRRSSSTSSLNGQAHNPQWLGARVSHPSADEYTDEEAAEQQKTLNEIQEFYRTMAQSTTTLKLHLSRIDSNQEQAQQISIWRSLGYTTAQIEIMLKKLTSTKSSQHQSQQNVLKLLSQIDSSSKHSMYLSLLHHLQHTTQLHNGDSSDYSSMQSYDTHQLRRLERTALEITDDAYDFMQYWSSMNVKNEVLMMQLMEEWDAEKKSDKFQQAIRRLQMLSQAQADIEAQTTGEKQLDGSASSPSLSLDTAATDQQPAASPRASYTDAATAHMTIAELDSELQQMQTALLEVQLQFQQQQQWLEEAQSQPQPTAHRNSVKSDKRQSLTMSTDMLLNPTNDFLRQQSFDNGQHELEQLERDTLHQQQQVELSVWQHKVDREEGKNERLSDEVRVLKQQYAELQINMTMGADTSLPDELLKPGIARQASMKLPPSADPDAERTTSLRQDIYSLIQQLTTSQKTNKLLEQQLKQLQVKLRDEKQDKRVSQVEANIRRMQMSVDFTALPPAAVAEPPAQDSSLLAVAATQPQPSSDDGLDDVILDYQQSITEEEADISELEREIDERLRVQHKLLAAVAAASPIVTEAVQSPDLTDTSTAPADVTDNGTIVNDTALASVDEAADEVAVSRTGGIINDRRNTKRSSLPTAERSSMFFDDRAMKPSKRNLLSYLSSSEDRVSLKSRDDAEPDDVLASKRRSMAAMNAKRNSMPSSVKLPTVSDSGEAEDASAASQAHSPTHRRSATFTPGARSAVDDLMTTMAAQHGHDEKMLLRRASARLFNTKLKIKPDPDDKPLNAKELEQYANLHTESDELHGQLDGLHQRLQAYKQQWLQYGELQQRNGALQQVIPVLQQKVAAMMEEIQREEPQAYMQMLMNGRAQQQQREQHEDNVASSRVRKESIDWRSLDEAAANQAREAALRQQAVHSVHADALTHPGAADPGIVEPFTAAAQSLAATDLNSQTADAASGASIANGTTTAAVAEFSSSLATVSNVSPREAVGLPAASPAAAVLGTTTAEAMSAHQTSASMASVNVQSSDELSQRSELLSTDASNRSSTSIQKLPGVDVSPNALHVSAQPQHLPAAPSNAAMSTSRLGVTAQPDAATSTSATATKPSVPASSLVSAAKPPPMPPHEARRNLLQRQEEHRRLKRMQIALRLQIQQAERVQRLFQPLKRFAAQSIESYEHKTATTEPGSPNRTVAELPATKLPFVRLQQTLDAHLSEMHAMRHSNSFQRMGVHEQGRVLARLSFDRHADASGTVSPAVTSLFGLQTFSLAGSKSTPQLPLARQSFRQQQPTLGLSVQSVGIARPAAGRADLSPPRRTAYDSVQERSTQHTSPMLFNKPLMKPTARPQPREPSTDDTNVNHPFGASLFGVNLKGLSTGRSSYSKLFGALRLQKSHEASRYRRDEMADMLASSIRAKLYAKHKIDRLETLQRKLQPIGDLAGRAY